MQMDADSEDTAFDAAAGANWVDIAAGETTSRIIERFGGIRQMAAKLGMPVTTVQGWKKRGIIPASRHADILTASSRARLAIDAADLAAADPGGAAGRNDPDFAEPPPDAPATPDAASAPVRPRRGWVLAVAMPALVIVACAAAVWQLYLHPLQDRVAALEAQRAGPDAADSNRLAAIERQVADIEASQAETARIAKQLSDLQVASQSRELLAQSIRDIQSTTAATQGQTERLAQQLASLDGRVDQLAAAQSERRQLGLRAEAVVLAVGQLRAALAQSKPFAKELAATRALVDGDADMIAILDQLQPFADDGVPSADELRDSFGRLAPEIVRSESVGDGTHWWQQALYQIRSVVSIRRVGKDVPGDKADAIVARAQERIDAGDLKGAIAALKPLSGLSEDIAASWVRDAGQRVTIDAAIADLSRLSIDRVAQGRGDGDAPAEPSLTASPTQ